MHDLEVELIKALTCGAEGSEMVCAADIARCQRRAKTAQLWRPKIAHSVIDQ
jgi:hypothetical protein